MYGGKFAFVGLTPALEVVVATEILVVTVVVALVVVKFVPEPGPKLFVPPTTPSFDASTKWLCPGSVTVDVAV